MLKLGKRTLRGREQDAERARLSKKKGEPIVEREPAFLGKDLHTFLLLPGEAVYLDKSRAGPLLLPVLWEIRGRKQNA